ncbi:hypothetical protein EP331_00255 [bacterium]|nr:MAG: hypothetical protein EP331_00255 [bacterium]
MAEGKKTFIFYSDWINMIQEMPDKDAGELLKHILSYVNDKNPQTDNLLVKMAFGHMKPMIKEDLKKWEEIREKRKKAGYKGGKANAKQMLSDAKQVQAVNVNVNDNVNVNANKENKAFSFKKSLIDLGVEEPQLSDWLKVRKAKRLTDSETAFNGFIKKCDESQMSINEIVKICAQNSWGGFDVEWMNNNQYGKQNNQNRRKQVIELLSQTDEWKDM